MDRSLPLEERLTAAVRVMQRHVERLVGLMAVLHSSGITPPAHTPRTRRAPDPEVDAAFVDLIGEDAADLRLPARDVVEPPGPPHPVERPPAVPRAAPDGRPDRLGGPRRDAEGRLMLYRLTRTHLTPYAVPLAVLLVLQLVATLASLYLPSLNGRIIDEGVAVGDTAFILRAGAVMLAVSLVQVATTIAATRIGAQTSASLGRDVRASVFSTVGRFSAQELSRFGAPTLISRSTNDVTQVQQVTYMFFAMMVSAPLMMVGGIFMALREDVGLSWLVAVAVPALAVAVGARHRVG